MQFQVRYLVLFLLFSVLDSFEWFWKKHLHKKIQLMLEFFNAPFLVMHISYYTLMTFLMTLGYTTVDTSDATLEMWSGIWSVAKIRIRLWTWIWSLRHWTGAGSGLLISMLERLNGFHMAGLITLVLFRWKWMGLLLRKNLLRCWDWLSKLDWGSYIISIAKTTSKKIAALIRSMKLLSFEVVLYLYNSTIRSCMESCCHVCTGAPSCYLELLDKLQKGMEDYWSITYCLFWTLGSSSKCNQLKFFM